MVEEFGKDYWQDDGEVFEAIDEMYASEDTIKKTRNKALLKSQDKDPKVRGVAKIIIKSKTKKEAKENTKIILANKYL